MRPQTSINRIIEQYPNIMDKFNGYDGMDDGIEPDYDEELETEDYHRV